MDRLDELKTKYHHVLSAIKENGVRLDNLHVQDNKLFLKGAAPNETIKNAIWNAIKEVDPSFGDLTCEISVDSSLPVPAPASQTYVVKAGDSLWKIAQNFYGNGSQFPKIIAANPGKLKDEKSVIHPGDQLVIPAA